MPANRSSEEPRLSDTSAEHQSTIDRNAPTQVGQVLQGLGSLTNRFPLSDVGRRFSTRASSTTSNEQISDLVGALGEPQHPDHARSLEMLIKIGRPAIPFLTEALQPHHSWLTTYRAAEALGCIGNGQATGALIRTLQHPNSNVRWSAVRALAQIGDFRALFELRRVVHDDHGRTTWGESVAGAAQSALDQLQANSVWSQSLELFKTAVTSVMMILALILAFSVVTTLRSDLREIGQATPDQLDLPALTTETDTQETADATLAPDELDDNPNEDNPVDAAALAEPATPDEAPADPEAGVDAPDDAEAGSDTDEADALPAPSEEVIGSVLNAANVRPFPTVEDRPIGFLSQGDEVVFLGTSPDNEWYLLRLGSSHADGSFIDNPDGSDSGWVHRMLLSVPEGDLRVIEDTELATPSPASSEPLDTESQN